MSKILNELSGHAFIILVVVLMTNGFSAAGQIQKNTAAAKMPNTMMKMANLLYWQVGMSIKSMK